MAMIPTTYNEKDNVWSGAKRNSMYNYDTSVGKIIFNNMKNWPKNVCQVSLPRKDCIWPISKLKSNPTDM